MKNSFFKLLVILLLFFMGFTAFKNGAVPVDKKATVYVFLSETCPVCRTYVRVLNETNKKYYSKGFEFVGVFSNVDLNIDSLDLFKKRARLAFELRVDKKAELANHFSATVTPEVFVESTGGELLYAGRIDDGVKDIKKGRETVTVYDLDQALSSILKNEPIKNPKTKALGSPIRLKK